MNKNEIEILLNTGSWAEFVLTCDILGVKNPFGVASLQGTSDADWDDIRLIVLQEMIKINKLRKR